jgi:hypothetical protein
MLDSLLPLLTFDKTFMQQRCGGHLSYPDISINIKPSISQCTPELNTFIYMSMPTKQDYQQNHVNSMIEDHAIDSFLLSM